MLIAGERLRLRGSLLAETTVEAAVTVAVIAGDPRVS
jgi:hypothetical protein